VHGQAVVGERKKQLGRDRVKTAHSVCYDIVREILREARQFSATEFRVVAGAEVVEMLLDEESQYLAGLSDFIQRPISLTAEPGNKTESYDIVLLRRRRATAPRPSRPSAIRP
jgi:ribonuclease G